MNNNNKKSKISYLWESDKCSEFIKKSQMKNQKKEEKNLLFGLDL